MSNLNSGIAPQAEATTAVSEMQRTAHHRLIYGSMADNVPMGSEPNEEALVKGASMGTVGVTADEYYGPVPALGELRTPKSST